MCAADFGTNIPFLSSVQMDIVLHEKCYERKKKKNVHEEIHRNITNGY